MKMTIDIVPARFHPYVGMRPRIADPIQRAEHMAFNLLTECLAPPDSPFVKNARNGLLLCDQTQSYLYDLSNKYGFIDKPYKKGSRQFLEDYIESVIGSGGSMSDADKVVALSQSLRDLPKRYPPPPAFLYGESDEQTILKGGGHCSCKARLLTALCQVLGLQARPAMMWMWCDTAHPSQPRLGGHTVTEVLLDGKWGFFDPERHLYCRTHDGSFPSIADIRRQPELFTKMPQTVVDQVQPVGYGKVAEDAGMSLFEYYWYKNFNPRCSTVISRHDVNDRYSGRWFWATREFRQQCQQEMAQWRQAIRDLAERDELTDEIYYMNLNQFRQRFGLTGAIQTFAGDRNWAPAPSRGGSRRKVVPAM